MSYTFFFLLTAFLFRKNDVNTNWMKFSENEQCSELRFQLAYTWINIFNAKLNVNFVCIVIHGKTGKCQHKKKIHVTLVLLCSLKMFKWFSHMCQPKILSFHIQLLLVVFVTILPALDAWWLVGRNGNNRQCPRRGIVVQMNKKKPIKQLNRSIETLSTML